jgi:hypothetical protein
MQQRRTRCCFPLVDPTKENAMSQVLDPQEQRRHLLFLSDPRLWPAWPFLPVIRRSSGAGDDYECGLLCDLDKLFSLPGYRCTVFLANLLLLPDTLGQFLALPKEVFDSPEEVFAAGWRVD